MKRTLMLERWVIAISVGALSLAVCQICSAQEAEHARYVGTWATSPMVASGGFAVRPFCGMTLREIAHISAGGEQIRIRLTNEFGLDQLMISDAHVALDANGSTIKPNTDHKLSFDGAASVSIPPGAVVYSDPVTLDAPPLSDVAVSFYLPSQVIRSETFHAFADQQNFMVDGDHAADPSLSNAKSLESWYFFDGIDVVGRKDGGAIVALGDSITDGTHSTPNGNDRWPDVLARRLQADPNLQYLGVLNEGIGGNRVLNDVYGPSALARLDRDVLAQDGAKYVIVLEGINDIGRFWQPQGPEDNVTAQQLEAGLKEIADAAHEHGMNVIGTTLTPYEGAGYYSPKGEQVREAVNAWIRRSGTFDGVIDFDKITRDPDNPKRFNPLYDSGDHLHPNDAGYKAMGDGIDLTLFK